MGTMYHSINPMIAQPLAKVGCLLLKSYQQSTKNMDVGSNGQSELNSKCPERAREYGINHFTKPQNLNKN